MNVRGEDCVAVVATDYPSLSDDELVACACTHDVHAFETLMRRYNRRLFRIARSILREDGLAEDAVQETHITAFTRLECYEPMGRFGAWLSRLAVNEALMLRRAERPLLSLNALSESAWVHSELFAKRAIDDDPSNVVHARQLLELAIDALPDAFRPVFMLRVVEQLSISETAECLALNEATVKTRLHRAQRTLQRQLLRRLRKERLTVFEFGGERCNRIVATVLSAILREDVSCVSETDQRSSHSCS